MKRFDRILQDWRIRKAAQWIPERAQLLDVGCFDGRLLAAMSNRIASGVGIDPLASEVPNMAHGDDRVQIIAESFLEADLPAGRFDVVTMLAVLEHVANDEIALWADTCRRCLRPSGLLVATIPSPRVDAILDVLIRWNVLDGMEFGQHHGVNPDEIVAAMQRAGFELLRWEPFQLALNNLVVFRRRATAEDTMAHNVAAPHDVGRP